MPQAITEKRERPERGLIGEILGHKCPIWAGMPYVRRDLYARRKKTDQVYANDDVVTADAGVTGRGYGRMLQ